MTTTITFDQDKTEALESPLSRIEGITETFVCAFPWATSAPSSGSAVAYRSSSGSGNGISVTSTVFPSGTITYGSTTVTLKPATSFTGNARYIISVTATVNGNVEVHDFKIDVRKDEAAA